MTAAGWSSPRSPEQVRGHQAHNWRGDLDEPSDPLVETPPGLDPGPDTHTTAGWSSPVARQAHNLKVRGSNPLPATNNIC